METIKQYMYNPELVFTLILLLATICALVYDVYKGKKNVAKVTILSLVIEAEKIYGKEMGQVKYAYVVRKVHPLLPFIVKLIISEEALGELIEDSVKFLKENLQCIEKEEPK